MSTWQHGDDDWARVTLRHSQFSTLKSRQLTRAETNLPLSFVCTPYAALGCFATQDSSQVRMLFPAHKYTQTGEAKPGSGGQLD